LSLYNRRRTRTARLRIEALEERALLSAVSESLTTSQAVYQRGQQVQLAFTITNITSHVIYLDYGPSFDGFNVTRAGKLVYQSNSGANPTLMVADPLQPGQSITLYGTWNGVSNQGTKSTPLRGKFTVTNQLDASGPSATFEIQSSPADTSTHHPTDDRARVSPVAQAVRDQHQSEPASPRSVETRGARSDR
jgi:Intracellular proteinase inhibitor